MSFRNFILAVFISVLLLMSVTVVNANTPQEPVITENEVVLEFAGSAFWNNAYYCDAVGDYAFLTMDFGLMIVDVSNKSNPQVASRLYMPSATGRIQKVGDYAYICGGGDMSTGTDWATLTIVDVSDVYNPSISSCYQNPDTIIGTGVKVIGDYAYVAGDGLQILNVSSPAWPWKISYYDPAYGGRQDLEIVGDTVYLTVGFHVIRIDVADPYYPAIIHPMLQTSTYGMEGIVVANDLVYVAHDDTGLTIVDPNHGPPYVLSDFPLGSSFSRDLVLVDDTIVFIGGEFSNTMKVLNVADPYAVDSIAKCGGPGQRSIGMDLDNDYLYVAREEDGLFINNVSNRAYPYQVGAFRECQDEPRTVEVRGNTGYLMFMDTIRIVDLSDPANITQIGWAEVGMNDALEIAGNTMLVGNTRGVTAFDISNPSSPVYLDMYLTDYNYVQSIKVRGDYAYITMYSHGWGIIDISDPNNLVMVGSYVDGDYLPSVNSMGTKEWAILDGYAFVAFYSPESLEYGFLVLDISDPTNPHPVKEHVVPRQIVCVDVMDSLLYFKRDGAGSVWVWDISDPLNPVQTAAWFPVVVPSFSPCLITHIGGYLLMESFSYHNLLVVDPSGWVDTCSGGVVARFDNHNYVTDIAVAGNNIYRTSNGGFIAYTIGLDFVCGDVNDDGGFGPDIADLVYLVDYMFTGGSPPPDMAAANIDGEPGITISDLVFLVDFMFNGGPPPIC